MSDNIALIVGAGSGLSASLARRFNSAGMKVVLAARTINKLSALLSETNSHAYECDASDPDSVKNLFTNVENNFGKPEVVIFNASQRVRGPITDINSDEVKSAILTTCYGGFLIGQEAAKLMLKSGKGTIMFTGASAGVKGFAQSATFAMGKFGLRGLAQSMARELHPQNIHVVHVIVDGGISSMEKGKVFEGNDDSLLLPESIADTYYHLYQQHRSSWTWEIEVRPWVEKF